jgi:hypothetical protein
MTVHFITFGGGAEKYVEAGQRLVKQAEAIGVFDTCQLFLAEDLQADKEFWSKHGDFITQNKRGYGYWLWKPYLLKKMMERMQDGDKLIYLDAGCEIDLNKKNSLLQHLTYVEEDYLIGSSTCFEREFCKIDLILKLDMLDPKYLETYQRQGGAVIYLVCPKTRDFINQWYDLCCDYHLLDDSPSQHNNLPGFQEHRHDQAIFSLLSKKYNLFSKHTIQSCVSIVRNCSGISLL